MIILCLLQQGVCSWHRQRLLWKAKDGSRLFSKAQLRTDPEARIFYLDRVELSHKHDTKHCDWHDAPWDSIALSTYLQKYKDLYLDEERLNSLRLYVTLVSQLRFASEEGRAILMESHIFRKAKYRLFGVYSLSVFCIFAIYLVYINYLFAIYIVYINRNTQKKLSNSING